MKNYRQKRFRKEKEEDPLKDIPKQSQDELNIDINKIDQNQIEFCKNQSIAFKKGNNYEENNSMSSNIYKSKYCQNEEKKETNDFTNTNKKLRNTMTGLNNDKMKYESGLIDVILKVERDNVNHYLKGDLAEMYHDINKNNYHFKNNVFLANVDNFERKTGIFDKKPIIPYYYSEDISYKLDKYPRTNEIIEKFTEKTKTFTAFE